MDEGDMDFLDPGGFLGIHHDTGIEHAFQFPAVPAEKPGAPKPFFLGGPYSLHQIARISARAEDEKHVSLFSQGIGLLEKILSKPMSFDIAVIVEISEFRQIPARAGLSV